MTKTTFQNFALSLPLTEKSSHMDHPDFRVGGKIFATLTADGKWGAVKLTPTQQAEFLARDPEVFTPAAGAWGKRGYTRVCLKSGSAKQVQAAMKLAWQNTAPKQLLKELGMADERQ